MIRSAFFGSTCLVALATALTACEGTDDPPPWVDIELQPLRAQPGEPPPGDEPPAPRPRPEEPRFYADLRLLGTMRLEWHMENNVYKVDALIDVKNFGTGITTGPGLDSGASIDGGTPYPASIHGTGMFADRILSGETGYIAIRNLDMPVLRECEVHTIRIDRDIRWQGWTTVTRPPFTLENDTGRVLTPCPMLWDGPISPIRMGHDPDPLAALQANPTIAPEPFAAPPEINLNGLSLGDIVSSRVQGSPLGYCSKCHNNKRTHNTAYNPDIAPLDAPSYDSYVFPSAVIDGWSWCGPSGWGERFLKAKPDGTLLKYEPLRRAIRKWLDDGCRFGSL